MIIFWCSQKLLCYKISCYSLPPYLSVMVPPSVIWFSSLLFFHLLFNSLSLTLGFFLLLWHYLPCQSYLASVLLQFPFLFLSFCLFLHNFFLCSFIMIVLIHVFSFLLMRDTSLLLRWFCFFQSIFASIFCFSSVSAFCYPNCMFPLSILFLLTASFLFSAFCASVLLSASASIISMQPLQSTFILLSSLICFLSPDLFFSNLLLCLSLSYSTLFPTSAVLVSGGYSWLNFLALQEVPTNQCFVVMQAVQSFFITFTT